jgi:hypothetical protein
VKLTDGKTLTMTVDSNTKLWQLQKQIGIQRTDGDMPFALIVPFPRRIFTREEMRTCTLKAAGRSPLHTTLLLPSSRSCS